MTSTSSVKDAIQDHLQAVVDASAPWPVKVFVGAPDATAGTQPYICIWWQTGAGHRSKYRANTDRIRLAWQLTCVARSLDALDDLVVIARMLLDWEPPGATPITEDGSHPITPETEDNDTRYVAPLTMHCWALNTSS